MICINSNEKLILQHLFETYSAENADCEYYYSESDNSVRLEMETWLERLKENDTKEDLLYYYVAKGPFNSYDIYADLKMIYRLTKSVVTRNFRLVLVLAYTDTDISDVNSLDTLANDLFALLVTLHKNAKCRFRFDMDVYYAYNVFGPYRSTDVSAANMIQQFINVINQQGNHYLVVHRNESVTGTEVKYLSLFLKEHHKAKSHKKETVQLPVIHKSHIPVPTAVSLEELMLATGKITHTVIDQPADPGQYMVREALFAEILSFDNAQRFIEQFLPYTR